MKKCVDILLFENALSLDFSGPAEVLEAATVILAAHGRVTEGYALRFCGLRAGTVRLSCGLRVQVEAAVTDRSDAGIVCGSCDMLLVPGGFGVEPFIAQQGALEHVQRMALGARRIVSVCNGSFILAAAGLLKGRKATTHWYRAEAFAEQFAETELRSESLYVRDGNIYTSAGVTAGIDMMLSIVEEDYGQALAMQVARILVLYLHRPGTQHQFSDPLELQRRAGTRFMSLHAWLLQHLHVSLSVETMAEHVGMSSRNFTRVFTRTTGHTPAKYVEELRLTRAREMLESGESNLDHVAACAGFGREERLRRAFARSLGVSPKQYQLHFATKKRNE